MTPVTDQILNCVEYWLKQCSRRGEACRRCPRSRECKSAYDSLIETRGPRDIDLNELSRWQMQYRFASKASKTMILNQFSQMMNYSRDYAKRKLRDFEDISRTSTKSV